MPAVQSEESGAVPRGRTRPETCIYYFSGTGNSLAVARQLAAELSGARLVAITGQLIPEMLVPSAPRIGLVFPLYFHGLPEIVLRLAKRLHLTEVRYAFCLITRGASSGQAVYQLQQLLSRKGVKLNLAAKLTMPGNYIAEYNTLPESKVQERVAAASQRTRQLARLIAAEEEAVEADSAADIAAARQLYEPWLLDVQGKDRHFFVEDTCTSCGACAGVCPVKNISLENGRPKWKHRCQQCFACIHFCPQAAIQLPGTKRRGRYYHPEVTAEDLIRRALPA